LVVLIVYSVDGKFVVIWVKISSDMLLLMFLLVMSLLSYMIRLVLVVIVVIMISIVIMELLGIRLVE